MHDETVYYTISALSAELGHDAHVIAQTIEVFHIQPAAMVALVWLGNSVELPVYDFGKIRSALQGGE